MNFAIVNADYKWWEAREFRPVLVWAATHDLWQRGKKREKNKWECTYLQHMGNVDYKCNRKNLSLEQNGREDHITMVR